MSPRLDALVVGNGSVDCANASLLGRTQKEGREVARRLAATGTCRHLATGSPRSPRVRAGGA